MYVHPDDNLIYILWIAQKRNSCVLAHFFAFAYIAETDGGSRTTGKQETRRSSQAIVGKSSKGTWTYTIYVYTHISNKWELQCAFADESHHLTLTRSKWHTLVLCSRMRYERNNNSARCAYNTNEPWGRNETRRSKRRSVDQLHIGQRSFSLFGQ